MSRSDEEANISMPHGRDREHGRRDQRRIEAETLAADTTSPPLPELLPDETAAAEFTDFLLEPLLLPATIATATAGEPERGTPEEAVPEPFDVMSEIEEELFAALPIEETVSGLSPQSLDAAQPAFAPAAPSPAIRDRGCAPGHGGGRPSSGRAPQATTPIGTATAVPTRTAAKPMPRPAPNDPLAALKAMSDEERIALFT